MPHSAHLQHTDSTSVTGLVFTTAVRGVTRWWALALLMALAACSGGSNTDKVRIGSGQSGSSGTTDSADYPLFYVKRITPDMSDADTDDDIRHVRKFSTNADLYMRERASVSATETNITARVHPSNELWDIKDVDVSADATKVIFAMRGPLDDDQEDKDPPSWNIWEYVIASDTLHRVISDDATAEEGQDISPHYLPDGHILFASTRQYQSKAVLLDENKSQFEAQDEDRDESASVLHVMDASGTRASIQQVTFNQSHDLDATVLSNGRILFSRWDHANGRNGVHFYTAKPNGTDTQLLFGSASHASIANTDINDNVTYPTVQFTKAREMQDGKILTLIKPFSGSEFGGDLYIIDTTNYVENNQAADGSSSLTGPAATRATPNNVQLVSGPSEGGRFVSAYPYWDGTGRLLVSWSQCRVIDPSTQAAVNCTAARLADSTFVAAQPIYSVWVLNPADGTQQPIVTPTDGVMVTDVVIAQPHTAPTYLPFNLDGDSSLSSTLRSEGVGLLDIRSVYDFDGTESAVGTGCSISSNANPTTTCYSNRPARFLRIEKAVSLPDMDVYDFDTNAFGATQFMREILGYIPVEPDGSVRVKVPGNVAFQISVTDSNGRRVSSFPRHNAWLTLRPGETVQCNGCHTTNRTRLSLDTNGRAVCPTGSTASGTQCLTSHGRSGSYTSVYSGAVGSSFTNANTLFSAITGQTMAQARAVWSCTNEQCASVTPSVNLHFADVWPAANSSSVDQSKVNPTTARSSDFSLVYAGTGGISTKLPTSSTCLLTWSNTCRITINYLEHIQPLWERDALTTSSLTGTCISCHTSNNKTQVPAGQLDLTSDASDDNTLQVTSYRELLFTDNRQQLNGTAVQDVCLVPAVDESGNVTGCTTFATVSPVLAARNAAGSRFFNTFSANQCLQSSGSIGTCSIDHTGALTKGELRLISEWVDIGAQYYNDPFKAPEN